MSALCLTLFHLTLALSVGTSMVFGSRLVELWAITKVLGITAIVANVISGLWYLSIATGMVA